MALKNIVGHQYGELTVISFSHTDAKHSYWNCLCSCGNTSLVRSNNLRTGNTTNCNDSSKHLFKNLVDVSGQKFGRLTAISINTETRWKGYRSFWNCQCSCDGKMIVVESGNLKSGHTTSCGCFMLEMITKHGCAKKATKRIYNIWRGMMDRCENENNKGYDNYGGKYISVCEEWHSPENFVEWALLNGYTDKLTIERKENHKGYNPENCKWIPLSEQNWNKTNTVGVENVKNIREVLSQGADPKLVAKFYGFEYSTIIAIKNNKCYKGI